MDYLGCEFQVSTITRLVADQSSKSFSLLIGAVLLRRRIVKHTCVFPGIPQHSTPTFTSRRPLLPQGGWNHIAIVADLARNAPK